MLPTEAQWEKAARGTDGRVYPWGDAWDPTKCVNATDSTHPVGSITAGASPYGALDMAGNVWEWCADWSDPAYYSSAPTHTPPGSATGSGRVLRGGSWLGGERDCRGAIRDFYSPDGRYYDVGFRCVVSSLRP